MSDEEDKLGPKHKFFAEEVHPLLQKVIQLLDDNDMGYLFMTATDVVEREGEHTFMSHCATNCRIPGEDPDDEFGNAPETLPMAYYMVYPSNSAAVDLRLLKHTLGKFLNHMVNMGDSSEMTMLAASLYDTINVVYETAAKESGMSESGEAEIIEFPGGNKTLH